MKTLLGIPCGGGSPANSRNAICYLNTISPRSTNFSKNLGYPQSAQPRILQHLGHPPNSPAKTFQNLGPAQHTSQGIFKTCVPTNCSPKTICALPKAPAKDSSTPGPPPKGTSQGISKTWALTQHTSQEFSTPVSPPNCSPKHFVPLPKAPAKDSSTPGPPRKGTSQGISKTWALTQHTSQGIFKTCVPTKLLTQNNLCFSQRHQPKILQHLDHPQRAPAKALQKFGHSPNTPVKEFSNPVPPPNCPVKATCATPKGTSQRFFNTWTTPKGPQPRHFKNSGSHQGTFKPCAPTELPSQSNLCHSQRHKPRTFQNLCCHQWFLLD